MDATVVPVAIHPPTDSSLLLDAVRVLDRLLHQTTRGLLHGVSPSWEAREAPRDGDSPYRAAGHRATTRVLSRAAAVTEATATYATCALAHLESLSSTPGASVLGAALRALLPRVAK